MGRKRSHCIECGLSFGLQERSEEIETTCVECLEKLRGRLIACHGCGRAIEAEHERHHVEWTILCADCVRDGNQFAGVKRALNRP